MWCLRKIFDTIRPSDCRVGVGNLSLPGMLKGLCLIFCFLMFVGVEAQQHRVSFDEFMSMVAAYIGDDDSGEALDLEELQERLSGFYAHPIEWNGASREQLEALLIVPDDQIEKLIYYAGEYGPVRSIYELRMVPGIEAPMLLLLPEVMSAGDVNDSVKWKDAFSRSSHYVAVRSDFSAERCAAYLSDPKEYLGADFRMLAKYRFAAGNSFRAGLTLESDPGEPWFASGGRGFDLYRFYAEASELPARLRVVLGSFRAGFGCGLLFGNRRYGSRVWQVLNPSVSGRGVSGYGGVSEAPGLFGASASASAGDVSLTAFYGYSGLDSDTAGGVWHSFSSSGYHRTVSELSRRDALALHTVGVNVAYRRLWYAVGATAYAGFFSLPAVCSGNDWSAMDFVGRTQWGVSADYMVKRWGMRFSGETAVAGGAVATFNSLAASVSSDAQLVINYRYFSPRYHAFWADAASSMSRVNGEHGASFALKTVVGRGVSVSLLADVYRPLWSSVQTSSSDIGGEVRADVLCQLRGATVMTAVARYRVRPEWYRSDDYRTAQSVTERVGLVQWRMSYGVEPFGFTSGVQANVAHSLPVRDTRTSVGFMMYQDLRFSPRSVPLTLYVRALYNYSPEWANRFYLYEQNVPETAYSPTLYGNACRWYLMASYSLPYGLKASLRVAQTIFFDRDHISSGRDRIDSFHRTDFSVYLSWKFR